MCRRGCADLPGSLSPMTRRHRERASDASRPSISNHGGIRMDPVVAHDVPGLADGGAAALAPCSRACSRRAKRSARATAGAPRGAALLTLNAGFGPFFNRPKWPHLQAALGHFAGRYRMLPHKHLPRTGNRFLPLARQSRNPTRAPLPRRNGCATLVAVFPTCSQLG
jgi:hypothetical protein